jgi:hypothetical protein
MELAARKRRRSNAQWYPLAGLLATGSPLAPMTSGGKALPNAVDAAKTSYRNDEAQHAIDDIAVHAHQIAVAARARAPEHLTLPSRSLEMRYSPQLELG